MQSIEPALRSPTLFLGERPVAFPRSSVGARRAHAVRTLLGMHRLRRRPESGFLTDFRVARELTRESGGSVPLGDMSLPRIWLEGLDLIGAWS
jgi:hypothetical protein